MKEDWTPEPSQARGLKSKNINVNPGQYKVAGRERQGENVVQERNKQKLVKNRERVGRPKSTKPQQGAKRSGRAKPPGKA